MTVDLPVSTAGFSNYTANSTVSGAQYGGVQALTLSLAVPDLTGTAGSILAEYNSGFNVTGSYNLGTTMSDMINATVDYLLGQLPDGLGTSASTISYLMSTMADHKVVKPLSNSSASVEFGVVNATANKIIPGQGLVNNDHYGNGYFSGDTIFEVSFPVQDFGEAFSGSHAIVLTSQNIWGENLTGYPNQQSKAALASVSVPVITSGLLTGTVTENNGPAADQSVVLTQLGSGGGAIAYYYETTDSSGQSRFFAQPGYQYAIQAVTPYGTLTGGNDTPGSIQGYNATNLNLTLGSVKFTESGLHGQTWSVSLNGITQQTSSNDIVFYDEIPGTYSYSVESETGYSVSSSPNPVTVSGSGATVTVTYTPTVYYTVKFTTNSNGGDPWGVSLDSYTQTTTGSSISFSEPDGQFHFEVVNAKGSNGYTYEWSASPSSGTVSVSGGNVQVSISLTLVGVIVPGGGGGGGGNGCVNGTTEILLANGTYVQAQNQSIVGSYVLTYNVTTQEYQAEEVMGLYISHRQTQYVINGFLKVSRYQPIWTNHGYVAAQNLTYHDKIYDAFTGSFVHVFSIGVQHGNYTMYDFFVPPNRDLIAWQFVIFDATIGP